MRHLITLLAAALLLTGCSTPPPVEGATGPRPTEPVTTPLNLGAEVDLGPWTVTVLEVNRDATELVRSANLTGPSPQRDRWVLARIRARYRGDGTVKASTALAAAWATRDGRVFPDSDCRVLVPDALINQPAVRADGQVEGNVCFDVPLDALRGTSVVVQERLSFTPASAEWAAEGR